MLFFEDRKRKRMAKAVSGAFPTSLPSAAIGEPLVPQLPVLFWFLMRNWAPVVYQAGSLSERPSANSR